MRFSIPIAVGAIGVVVAFGAISTPALARASINYTYCVNYTYPQLGDCGSMGYGAYGGNYSSYGYGYGYGYGGSYYQPTPYPYYPQPQPKYTYQPPVVPRYTYPIQTAYYYYPPVTYDYYDYDYDYDYYDYYDFDAPDVYACSGWCY